MIKVDDVANYMLWVACQSGDLITNLKLQKLAYYAQAWHLANKDEPLFQGDFEAWVHGPVHVDLYLRFSSFGWKPIGMDAFFGAKKPELPSGVNEHLDEIIEVYFDYTGRSLEIMVRNEIPWINARQGISQSEPSRNIIKNDDMKMYYRLIQKNKL